VEHEPFECGLRGKAGTGTRIIRTNRRQWRRLDCGEAHFAAVGQSEGLAIDDVCDLAPDNVWAGAICGRAERRRALLSAGRESRECGGSEPTRRICASIELHDASSPPVAGRSI
jgi:hypothetical protein